MFNFILRGYATKWLVQHRDDLESYAQTVHGDFSWRPLFGEPVTYLKHEQHVMKASSYLAFIQ